MKHIVFASTYCPIDYSSGAAVATGDGLELLGRCGFACEAFCAAKLDFGEEVCLEETLSNLRLPWQARDVVAGPHRTRLLFTRRGLVPVTIFRNPFTRTGPTAGDAAALLAASQRFLEKATPHVILTYGGDPLRQAMIQEARRRGIAVVFALYNLAYRDVRVFRNMD